MSRKLPAPRSDWAYFLDLDGTLLEFADPPAHASENGRLRTLLAGLYRATGGAVAVVSGRALADVDRLLGPGGPRLPAAGQHGIERRDAKGHVTHHPFAAARLERVREQLAAAVAARPGLVLEHKGASLALHYRRAPQLGGYAHRLVRSLVPHLGPRFRIQAGKRVVEVKPAGRDKGAAVLEFMREPPFRGRAAVFIGDDVADEHGFTAVNRLGGLSIKVGPGRTVARWRLRNVAAVWAWLASGWGALP
jgi:trehalose 6-phosphate phosphatase